MAEQGDKDLSLKGDPPLPFGPRKNTTWKNESFYSQKNVFFFTPQKENAVGSQPSTRRLDSGWFFMAGQPNPHPPRKK